MADDHSAVYQALADLQTSRRPAALATVTETHGSIPRHAGSKMLVYSDGHIVGTIGGGAMENEVIQRALQVIRDGTSCVERYTLSSIAAGDPGICGGTAHVFIEPIASPAQLLIVGAGHVGREVAALGRWLGYTVTLSDDRPQYASPEMAPDLDRYLVCAPDQVTQQFAVDAQTFVVALTRGLPVDRLLIPSLLQTPAVYIGLIGSRRRWAITARALLQAGTVDAQGLQRIHAPVGLELQAESPREIALSIMAEITMLRRGGDGRPMQWHGYTAQGQSLDALLQDEDAG